MTAELWLRTLARLKALRAAQRASGQPVFACGTCRGDSRYDPTLPVQSLTCECCGAPVTLRRQPDGLLLSEPGLLALPGTQKGPPGPRG